MPLPLDLYGGITLEKCVMATQATPFTFYHLVFNNLLVEFIGLRLTHRVMQHQDSVTENIFFYSLVAFSCGLNEEQMLWKWPHFKMRTE